MKTNNSFHSFNAYWPAYLRAHADPRTQICHVLGTGISLLFGLLIARSGLVFFLPLALVPALVGARLGHRLSLRGAEISAESPVWAVLADLKLFALFLSGRVGRALDRVETT